MPTQTHQVKIGNRQLSVSNLDKVMYPGAGFTKGDVIQYYAQIAPVLLPHLKDRALTMKRYPDGVDGQHFYEKRCPSHRPPWVRTANIWSESNGEEIPFCLINEVAALVWAANLASLELHTSLAKAQHPDRPTMMVFDLDPGAPAGMRECARVALLLRGELGELEAYPKTSGSKGLQVYVPINRPANYETTSGIARRLAERLQSEHPELVVSNMSKKLRVGKVLVDWSQNARHKTTVSVYSLRAKPEPRVSTPVTWKEVQSAAQSRAAEPLSFTAQEVLRRVEKHGDLFAGVARTRQSLRALG